MRSDRPLPPRTSKQMATSKLNVKDNKFRWGRAILIAVSLVIVGLVGYAGYLYLGYKDTIHKVASQDENAASPIPSSERAQVKPISLVLLGLDYRKELGSMNTDVMMVAAFNPKSKTATVVSIPRDSDLNLADYKTHKANAYYANFYMQAKNKEKLESEDAKQYARTKTREMLEKFFEIPINYTAVIDFQGFVDVIDALGGVDVKVDKDMRYVDKADGTNIDLTKGEQTLKGEDALGFVRYRKSNRGTAESSDFERNARQQEVLGAITDKLKSFGTVWKIDSIFNAVGDNMRTDIPEAQIENMIATYLGINRSDIHFIALEGTWKSPYVNLNKEKLAEAKQALAEELSPLGRSLSAPVDAQYTRDERPMESRVVLCYNQIRFS
ncbi:MAG: LCP family protein [Candidatus Cohnella colombiensis]|uniref:LCP family protein n=1 Tax=Candidatus Cohnella colombiensis TaxID=3121368 RepID=A0AA95EU99_9BACL|nr:MAG: LCP family protein [Cohnella sp.]